MTETAFQAKENKFGLWRFYHLLHARKRALEMLDAMWSEFPDKRLEVAVMVPVCGTIRDIEQLLATTQDPFVSVACTRIVEQFELIGPYIYTEVMPEFEDVLDYGVSPAGAREFARVLSILEEIMEKAEERLPPLDFFHLG